MLEKKRGRREEKRREGEKRKEEERGRREKKRSEGERERERGREIERERD